MIKYCVSWNRSSQKNQIISKKLGKNDIIFPRINYSLYKILFEQNGKKEIKAEIIPWNNGNDICEYIKNH